MLGKIVTILLEVTKEAVQLSELGNQYSTQRLSKLLLVAFCVVLVLKLLLASLLDLYSDEVFYWQASAYPALAYSDLPFMTALLAGIGSSLDSGNPFAVRLLFIALGTALPALIYWLALPITNQKQALEAAGLCLCLPLAGFLGLLAVPDVPLLVFGILAVGNFDRALRTNNIRSWMAVGLFVALGLSTHYRFFLYPFAAFLFLVCFKPARIQFKNPRLWIAVVIASIGLFPILWFNLSNQLSSASFYFYERHPWEFQVSGLLHLFKQAGLSTPPLYLAFIVTLISVFKFARNGNQSAALLLSVSLSNLAVYALLAPWTDATSTSIHWPLSGYLPLLVFLPLSLRTIFQWAENKWNRTSAKRIVAAIPAIGFSGTLIALIGVGSQAFQLPLQNILGTGILSNKMAGWQEFSEVTQHLISREFGDSNPVIVTDNYYTAAQVEFAGISRDVYTLDNDKAIRDGRITQYRLWQKDSAALNSEVGRPVLYINEDSTLNIPDKHQLLEQMCKQVNQIEPIEELSLFNGDKRFSFYKTGILRDGNLGPESRARPCPFPARAWIDYPEAQQILTGIVEISGWAYNEDIGIESVELIVETEIVATANYGIRRPDVVTAMDVQSDPNSPALGFTINFDSTQFENGEVNLAIDLINQQGTRSRYGNRLVNIRN